MKERYSYLLIVSIVFAGEHARSNRPFVLILAEALDGTNPVRRKK